jgi:hypothetical protein
MALTLPSPPRKLAKAGVQGDRLNLGSLDSRFRVAFAGTTSKILMFGNSFPVGHLGGNADLPNRWFDGK